MNSVQDPNTVQVNRLIQASPACVFAAWTTPSAIQRWFGPGLSKAEAVELDLRVGGRYRIHVNSPQHGRMSVSGEYREITPGAKLVYTWRWDDDEDWANVESVVTVEFVPVGQGTEVRVTHHGFPTDESRGNHDFGWSGAFVKLTTRLETINEFCQAGRFSWNELIVDDVQKAGAFYSQLFGWEAVPMEGGMPYTIFQKDGHKVGGMMAKPRPEAPAQWLAYVTVDSAKESTEKVQALGGQVIVPPFDIPNVGSIAVCHDPAGISFGLFQPQA